MMLTTKKEKIEFLNECYFHINRIYNTYLTVSEKRSANVNATDKMRYITLSEGKLNESLPISINIGGFVHNVKDHKLFVLTSIYNEVATQVESEQSFDLEEFFSSIKYDLEYLSKHGDGVNGIRLNILMRTHRSYIFRKGYLRFLFDWDAPSSEEFLEKYGFFESESELPLVEAVKNQQINEVDCLVSQATVNKKDAYGHGATPLFVAAYTGNLQITQILINYGANVDSNVLFAAIRSRNKDIVAELLKKDGANVDSNVLIAAIRSGNKDIVAELLKKYSDVNNPDSLGRTPLRQVIYEIECRFRVECINNRATDLQPYLEIFGEIIKKPIKWDKHTKEGQTIFEYAKLIREKIRRRARVTNINSNSAPGDKNTAVIELICKTMHYFFVNYILNTPGEFKRLIENRFSFRLLLEEYPSQHEDLVNYILNTPGEFKRLVVSSDDFCYLLKKISSQHEALVNYILNTPGEFKRLIENGFSFRQLLEEYPSQQYSSQHEDLVNYILNTPGEYERLVECRVMGCKPNFITLIEKFPSQHEAIITNFFYRPKEFGHYIKFSYYLKMLQKACYNKFPHFNYVLSQPDDSAAQIARVNFFKKQDLLHQMKLMHTPRTLTQLAIKQHSSSISQLPASIILLITSFAVDFAFSSTTEKLVLKQINCSEKKITMMNHRYCLPLPFKLYRMRLTKELNRYQDQRRKSSQQKSTLRFPEQQTL